MTNLIQQDLDSALNGETEVTLAQAVATIAAHFHDPAMGQDRESGTYVERNQMGWSQRMAIQSLANMAWRQLYDTTVDKSSRVRGIHHKLDKARSYAKNLAMKLNGGEIDIEAMNRAADWIERLEVEYEALEEMFDTAAAMYEAATGDNFKPYEPWLKGQKEIPEADDAKVAEVQARMARLGITIAAPLELNTDGVNTVESDVA